MVSRQEAAELMNEPESGLHELPYHVVGGDLESELPQEMDLRLSRATIRRARDRNAAISSYAADFCPL